MWGLTNLEDGSVVKAHETPHTPTASPPEESPQLFEKAEPSPTPLPVRSLNRTKLKMSSVQDQDDLTATLAPQHMEKVHKDDSSDYKHEVENTPFYKLKLAVRSVEKRKYKALTEKEEIAETPIARDAIIGDSAHGNSALDDNDEYEPQEHQTGLDDVPQLTTQVKTCNHTDKEEDDKMTNCPRNNDMETGVWRGTRRPTRTLLMTMTKKKLFKMKMMTYLRTMIKQRRKLYMNPATSLAMSIPYKASRGCI